MEYRVDEYIEGVLNGTIVTGRLTRLAVERHVNDLLKVSNPEYKYYFNEEFARYFIDFFEFCKHSKGEWVGDPVILEPWQQFIVAMVFGWLRKGNDLRRFRTVYEEVARKNGKSTKLAGIGLSLLIADEEAGAEIYTAATDKDQAKIIWNEAASMAKKSEDLLEEVEVFAKAIVNGELEGKFSYLSSETKNKDGLNVHGGLIDEYHAHPNDEIYNLVKSGTASRTQAIVWIITTAGFNMSSSCKRERDYAQKILQGTVDNDEYFAIIYTLDEHDDWKDPANWVKANPNWGVSVKPDQFESQFTEAVGRPAKINEFKTKRLNIWTTAYTRWILHEKWIANNGAVNESALVGRRCFAAMDLSTTTDLSGYCLVFPPENGEEKFQCLWRFYLPLDGLSDRVLREDVPYKVWVAAGWVVCTDGEVIDYDYIEMDILKDAERFDIAEFAYDRYNATALVNHLMEHGLNMIDFPQGIVAVSPAVKNLEIMVLNQQLATGGNPVMDYMIGCAEVYSDANNNQKIIKPDRRSSSKRIDGVIMLMMAVYRAVLDLTESGSVYEERGVRSL